MTFKLFSSLSTFGKHFKFLYVCSCVAPLSFLVTTFTKHFHGETVYFPILYYVYDFTAAGGIYFYLNSLFVCCRFLSSKLLLNLEINVSFTLLVGAVVRKKNTYKTVKLGREYRAKLVPF